MVNKDIFVARATDNFRKGYNCSQSVALAFAEYYNIPESLMARMSSSFGAGIGRMRETCGAACGMFMLAGLQLDRGVDNPYPSQDAKQRNYQDVQYLAEEFRKVTGSLCCRELLGLNKQRTDGTLPEISPVPEARTDEYYRKRPCIRMVEIATSVYCDWLNRCHE